MYNYEEIKPKLFTEEGQKMFLDIRDNVQRLFKTAEVITMDQAMKCSLGGTSWDHMACVDRLKELKEIQEISGQGVIAQHRVFTSRKFKS